MQVKPLLNDVRIKYYELKATEENLAAIRDRAMGDGSPKIDKLNVQTSLPADAMAEAITEYADLLDNYYDLKQKYKSYFNFAEQILSNYSTDIIEQTILHLRFFEFQTYGDIGKQYSMNYQQTKNYINIALRKMQDRVDNYPHYDSTY